MKGVFYDFNDCEPIICDEREETENECIICGNKNIGYGNNPIPVIMYGRCCDSCNSKLVIPYRRKLIIEDKAKISFSI